MARPSATLGPAPQDRLTRFDQLYAPLLAAWVRSAEELTWLATGTAPPLTPAKIATWGADRPNRYLYWRHGHNTPSAYAELNLLHDSPDQMWVGHFLVDPICRGRSIGQTFMSRLLELAFHRFGAAGVLLVVFPENGPAVRCYERCGLTALGRESRHFATTGRRHEFLRMGIGRSEFARWVQAGAFRAAAPEVDPTARPYRATRTM